jgi:hypothetical protein
MLKSLKRPVTGFCHKIAYVAFEPDSSFPTRITKEYEVVCRNWSSPAGSCVLLAISLTRCFYKFSGPGINGDVEERVLGPDETHVPNFCANLGTDHHFEILDVLLALRKS